MARIVFDYRDKYRRSIERPEDIKHVLRLRIKSMSATSGPPIGPVLGQYAIPISKFCTEYNERSTIFKSDVPVFVTLYHCVDGSYTFDLSPPISSLCILRVAGSSWGLGLPGHGKYCGFITPFQLYEAMFFQLGTKGGLGNYSIYATVRK